MIHANKEEIDKQVIEVFEKHIRELSQTQNVVTLGLCGGRSVSSIFEKLVYADIEWKNVHVFLVDDRLVPLENDDSNGKLVKDFLIDHIPESVFPKENFHPFLFDPELEDYGVSRYTYEFLGVSNHFDIVLLSAGEDGHIAGLFPQHTVLNSEMFFFMFADSPKPPALRMSASRKLILSSQVGILLFVGQAKKQALQHYIDDSHSITDVPAKLVKYLPKTYVFSDIDDKRSSF